MGIASSCFNKNFYQHLSLQKNESILEFGTKLFGIYLPNARINGGDRSSKLRAAGIQLFPISQKMPWQNWQNFKTGLKVFYLDLPPGPQDAIVANEGLGWDSLYTKNVINNPGGDDCILGGG